MADRDEVVGLVAVRERAVEALEVAAQLVALGDRGDPAGPVRRGLGGGLPAPPGGGEVLRGLRDHLVGLLACADPELAADRSQALAEALQDALGGEVRGVVEQEAGDAEADLGAERALVDQRVGPGLDLVAVALAVPVGVDPGRVGAVAVDLVVIRQAVAQPALAVAVGVVAVGRGAGGELRAVEQPVAVGVRLARVDPLGVLERQLAGVLDPVLVGVARARVELALELDAVGDAVAV